MASVVLFTMLLLMPLFHYTPNVILSAIIISAVIGLIDVRGAILLWKVDKFDFLACMSAFLGVLLLSVPIGLSISVSALHSTAISACGNQKKRSHLFGRWAYRFSRFCFMPLGRTLRSWGTSREQTATEIWHSTKKPQGCLRF